MTNKPAELRQQFELTRQFVAGTMTATDYIHDFLHLHCNGFDVPITDEGLAMSCWVGDVWFDIDNHNGYDHLREPDQFDDDQLREVLARHLAEWDAGEFVPDTDWKR